MDYFTRRLVVGRWHGAFIFNVLLLFVNLTFMLLHLDGRFRSVESFFESNLDRDDKRAMLETLRVFVRAMDAANVSRYFLYGGSLIGSYRHHGPIPWDDDIDIMVDVADKNRVFDALNALRPEYVIHYYGERSDRWQWKFYDNRSSAATTRTFVHKPFKWPYVDLFFFAQNATHIWDEVPMYSHQFCWPKTIVFPLRKRPFAGLSVPAPCDTEAFIITNYDVDTCRSRGYSHVLEFSTLQLTYKDLPCEKLHHLYPFVRARSGRVTAGDDDGDVIETLGIGEWETTTVRISRGGKCNGVLT